MLVVDDMRMDDLFAMPRTRRWLERGGTEWTNALSPYPLCCPARASIYTGEYTHNHDVLSHQPPYGFNSFDDSSTLATWLDGAGYKTSFLGKYLNGWGSQPPHGETEGDSLRYFPPGWDDWRGAPDGHGVYRYWGTELSQNRGRGLTTLRGYQSTAYGSIASEMIRGQAASTTPFFTQVSFTAPHHGQPREAGRDPDPVRRDDGAVTDLVTPASPPTTRDTFDDIRSAPGAGWQRPRHDRHATRAARRACAEHCRADRHGRGAPATTGSPWRRPTSRSTRSCGSSRAPASSDGPT